MKTLKMLSTAALLIGIGGCAGSNVQYFQVALEGSSTAATGTDCPGIGNDVITLTGIDGVGTWAIYTAPNSQYLLDGAVTGELLTGTLSGGVYTFSASVIVDDKTTVTETTYTIKYTVTLTLSGSGGTGTITQEQICSSGNGTSCGTAEITAACGAANGLCGTDTTGSADSADFDCTSQASVTATQINNVTPIHAEGAASASAANGGGNNGGGNNGGGNNGGGNGGNNGGNGGGNGGNAGTCTESVGGSNYCTQYIGSSYTASAVQAACTSGTYASGACPPGAGTCDVGSGTATEYMETFPSGSDTTADQSSCTAEGGTWN